MQLNFWSLVGRFYVVIGCMGHNGGEGALWSFELHVDVTGRASKEPC